MLQKHYSSVTFPNKTDKHRFIAGCPICVHRKLGSQGGKAGDGTLLVLGFTGHLPQLPQVSRDSWLSAKAVSTLCRPSPSCPLTWWGKWHYPVSWYQTHRPSGFLPTRLNSTLRHEHGLMRDKRLRARERKRITRKGLGSFSLIAYYYHLLWSNDDIQDLKTAGTCNANDRAIMKKHSGAVSELEILVFGF